MVAPNAFPLRLDSAGHRNRALGGGRPKLDVLAKLDNKRVRPLGQSALLDDVQVGEKLVHQFALTRFVAPMTQLRLDIHDDEIGLRGPGEVDRL